MLMPLDFSRLSNDFIPSDFLLPFPHYGHPPFEDFQTGFFFGNNPFPETPLFAVLGGFPGPAFHNPRIMLCADNWEDSGSKGVCVGGVFPLNISRPQFGAREL